MSDAQRPSVRLPRPGLWSMVVAATVVAVLVALPSLPNGFVYDDVWIVERNDVVHTLNWWELLTSPFWPEGRGGVMWRPLTLTGFALQWALGGGAPAVFHLVNVVLYGVTTALVTLLCARAFHPQLGLLAGILFAVHPVHVEVTANVVGQAELWAALGYLGALVAAFERSAISGSRTRLVLLLVTLASLALGLAGKELPVSFLAALVVMWWLRARQRGASLVSIAQREWPVVVAAAVLIGGFVLARAEFARGAAEAGGIATGLDPTSMLPRAVVMLPVSLRWLEVLFVPLRLSADYSPQHLVPVAAFGLNHSVALVIWLALLALVWKQRERLPAVFVGASLFVVSVAVVSNVVVPMEVLMAERLLFFPSFGWALAVAGALDAGIGVVTGPAKRGIAMGLAAAAVFLLAGRSVQRATVWRNNDVFFAQMLEDAPESYQAHWAVGWRAFERGDSVLGEREMLTAVRLNPNSAQLLEDMGRLYAATGRYEPAVPLLNHAVALDSSRLSSALPLALALSRTDRAAEGLVVLDAMARRHGRTPGLALVRGEVLMRSGDFEGAMEVLIWLTRQEPGTWSFHAMVADAAAQGGHCDVALAQADTAIALAPEGNRAAIEALRARVANGNVPCK